MSHLAVAEPKLPASVLCHSVLKMLYLCQLGNAKVQYSYIIVVGALLSFSTTVLNCTVASVSPLFTRVLSQVLCLTNEAPYRQ